MSLRSLLVSVARAAAIDAPDDKNYSGFTEADAQRIADRVIASHEDEIAEVDALSTPTASNYLNVDAMRLRVEFLEKYATQIDAAHRAEVERAVAERDGARQEAEQWRTARRESEDYIAAVVKATGDTWTGRIDFLTHIARLAALSARVAKLEAALREMVEAVDGAARPTCDDDECCGSCVIEAKDKARATLEDKP